MPAGALADTWHDITEALTGPGPPPNIYDPKPTRPKRFWRAVRGRIVAHDLESNPSITNIELQEFQHGRQPSELGPPPRPVPDSLFPVALPPRPPSDSSTSTIIHHSRLMIFIRSFWADTTIRYRVWQAYRNRKYRA
ncbi:hypothetical protein DL546_008440 [Coniochaeta pulveracea]|uniref:Uncharacterized protein n=1 Tax=Coniochaeta pulveracea TaxID=177199 RepID=A0A420YJL7_9PEZI|nr:hypothetical protein DL546_008440 [Coniochaeta pulveracea]